MGRVATERRVGATGSSSVRGNENVKIFVPEKPVEIIRPTWKPDNFATTVHLTGAIRSTDPMSGKKLKNKKRMPLRSAAGKMGLNNFYAKFPVVTVGNFEGANVQFVLDDLPEDGIWRNDSGDHTFYGQIVNECVRAYKKRMDSKTSTFRAKVGKREYDPADWSSLLPVQGAHYKNRIFSTAGSGAMFGFFPCTPLIDRDYLRWKDGHTPGCSSGEIPSIMVASGSATEAIENEIDKPAEGYDEPTSDPESWLYGDPTNPDGTGKWLVLYNEELKTKFAQQLGIGGAIEITDVDDIPDGSAGGSDKDRNFSSYEAAFIDSVVGPANKKEGRARYKVEKCFSKSTAAAALDNFESIYSYVYIGDEEEQAFWIYSVISTYTHGMDILRYGTRDRPEFWTDEIKAHMSNRKHIAVGSNTQDVEDGESPVFDTGEEDDIPEVGDGVDIDALIGDDPGDGAEIIEEPGTSAMSGAGLDLDDPNVFDDSEYDEAAAGLESLLGGGPAKKKSAKKKGSKKKLAKGKTTKKKFTKKVTKKKAVKKKAAKKPVVKKKVVKKKTKKSS